MATARWSRTPALRIDQHYYRLAGSEIWLPKQSEDRPSREFLEWHADSVFLG